MRPLAVITGASSGIGRQLAGIAAEAGYDLLIAADRPELEDAASELRRFGVDVRAVVTDLARSEGVRQLIDALEGRVPDVLCANAGHGLGGAFCSQPPEDWRHVIATNISGTVDLLQQMLLLMIERGEGRVLVTGSIAEAIPGSFQAVYNASKAFLGNFTEALRNELKEVKGVSITTLMPGPTDTDFFERANMEDTRVGTSPKDDPVRVARDGWKAMMAGEATVVSGLKNKIQAVTANIVPDATLAEQHRKMAEPGGGLE